MTLATTTTATKIANPRQLFLQIKKPSIQAIERWLGDAVEVSIMMLATDATTRILNVKSSRAVQINSK